MTTYYCPRGCQTCNERAAIVTGFECGACGATMTTDSTRYDALHDAIEEEQIADFERQVRAEILNAMQNAFCGRGDLAAATASMCGYLASLTAEQRQQELAHLSDPRSAFDEQWRDWIHRNKL